MSATEKSSSGLATLWGNIFPSSGDDGKDSLIKILKEVPLFRELRKSELRSISKIMYERNFEKGEYMFETGQPGAAMFIIIEGEVKIIKIDNDGEELDLATLSEGEFLGELALLDSSPRSASALITERTKAMAIFREDLHKLLETDPQLGGKVMKQLAVIIGIRLKATNNLLLKKEKE
ncbi:MAG: cyclic nucleotide-binding domain-containing protein [Melioribacteraceae bacterium]|nr:cyclic nucleotide-binding domain-containing protein [Melioribacteraceae bacterium]MCF8264798.1 cyclic nucleotide-binding domain-containing protein [Melioribacteraceae bacterium]MCF8412890.1 cyclic nucleotide-binding domain-containing protein [Melioribacteraceae bacterium]